MTLLRTNPSAYAVYIEQHLQTFQDDLTFKRDIQDFLIKTKEGKKAVEECISVLRNQAVLCSIEASQLLEMAALAHQRDTSKNNLLGHSGSDSSTPQERVERFCVWRGIVGENIDYGNIFISIMNIYIFNIEMKNSKILLSTMSTLFTYDNHNTLITNVLSS